MAAYADYTYYTNTYLGSAIASADFNRLALRASAEIDKLTFDNAAVILAAATETAVIDKIKTATCAIAEEIQRQETEGDLGGVSSERVGNHSISFSANSLAALSPDQKIERVAKLYLANTYLMYRGVYPVTDETEL